MISSSSSIIKVIKSISELDRSILDDPIKFEGYIKDIYSGNSVVVDDFVTVLRNLSDSIIGHTVNSSIINSSCNSLKKFLCLLKASCVFFFFFKNNCSNEYSAPNQYFSYFLLGQSLSPCPKYILSFTVPWI